MTTCPPLESAGAWHAQCLLESVYGEAWYAAKLRNFVSVRRFPALFELLGIADRVVHPEALESSVLRYAHDMAGDWHHDFVSGRAEYGVFIPAVLEPYIARALWPGRPHRPDK